MNALDFYKIQLNNAVLNNPPVKRKPIGAWCEIENIPEGDTLTAYFSFAGLNEDESALTDGAGIPDDRIFYYCDDGEAEIIELMQSTQDFKVLSYSLEY